MRAILPVLSLIANHWQCVLIINALLYWVGYYSAWVYVPAAGVSVALAMTFVAVLFSGGAQ